MIRTLAVARSVAPLAGTNLAADTVGGSAETGWAECTAARSNKEPIIMDTLTRMKRHGYPLVRHCSKMDRFFGVASMGPLC